MLPSEVPGLITHEEGAWLARQAAGGTVLEIGAFRGRSTCYLASGAHAVITCEPFTGQPQLRPGRRRLDFREVRHSWHHHVSAAGFAGRVTLLERRSDEAYAFLLNDLESALDLVFVDGSHYSPALRIDVCFANLLRPGGIIAFHDYTRTEYPDVKRVVDAWHARFSAEFAGVDAPGSIRAFRKLYDRAVPDDWFIG
jgi:predicted O-methyltransferase YrrM